MKKIPRKFQSNNDTGFSTLGKGQGGRLINSDGSLNVKRTGIPLVDSISFFHTLLTMKWWLFSLIILLYYVVVNLLFALLYLAVGVEQLGGMVAVNVTDAFWEAFFFSCESLTTVGYGRVNPIGLGANALAALESLFGLMTIAMITGLLYGRFSRPTVKLVVSHNILISPYQNITGLMFRIANAHKKQLIEVEAQLILSINVVEDDKTLRRFYTLKLERDKVAALALNWTIVHPIDDDSPIAGMSLTDLQEGDAEFIFMLKAFDNTYSQNVHTRTSYKHSDIVVGAKFVQMFHPTDDGKGTLLQMEKISEYTPAELPMRLQKVVSE